METMVEDYQSFRFDHVNAVGSTGGNFSTPDSDLITSEPSPASGSSSDGESSPKDYNGDFSNTPLLKFIAEMLMDEGEDLTAQPCMLADCLALQAAERSFYDVIGQNYPDQTQSLPCSSSEDSSVLTTEKKSNHHQREYLGEEGRASKQAAVFSTDSSELSEIFDEVLLCQNPGKDEEEEEEEEEEILGREKPKKVQRKKTRNKKRNGGERGREVVDLWSLLSQCAQAVAGYDQASTAQLLAQIRRHSSPDGDSTERLAHYFANGLEARFSAGTPQYRPLGSNGASAYDVLKAYQVYIKACPFKRMSNFYANRTILKLAEQATTIHIIDFGILYGYQWPCLIQKLSEQPGGPPRVRITGIELPQPGFRPAERVEQTARRLENYCQRFNVEFECRVIAKKWEDVRVEELGLDRSPGEVTVVNCLYRMENLLDDTVVEDDCPRDAVLKLVRRVNPDLFILGVASGTHSAPFFLTRFREAMFHFSALFDMFEASLGRGDPHRAMFEREVFGRDVMNVVACEGPQRVERPETYRQWQARNGRAGLRQVGLDGDLVKRVKGMVRRHYHPDFVVDRDGDWLLQGWKGRIFHAISCWRAA